MKRMINSPTINEKWISSMKPVPALGQMARSALLRTFQPVHHRIGVVASHLAPRCEKLGAAPHGRATIASGRNSTFSLRAQRPPLAPDYVLYLREGHNGGICANGCSCPPLPVIEMSGQCPQNVWILSGECK